MIISKSAHNALHYYRDTRFFENARSAFKEYMRSLDFRPEEQVLLPAYIGWSSREGSGVFDPVRELGVRYAFYAMDDHLHIDLESLKKTLQAHKVKLFVIIHYFGFVDPHFEEAVCLAKENGALVLEDQAHSLFTDIIGGISGHLGDASIFSLHKMLPVPDGGLLCVNKPSSLRSGNTHELTPCKIFFGYDLGGIAKKRIRNAEVLARELEGAGDILTPLWTELPDGVVPQTYPVIVRNVSRDALYDAMNNAGFGVVSLYHTLIDRISREDFPISHSLSRRILNLPVHQDAEADDLKMMVDTLVETCRSMKEGVE